jgi:uncharacterized protein (DUF1778 family)
VSREQKELIEQAAAHTGQAVFDFIMARVEIAAQKVINECRRIRLNPSQSQTLTGALLATEKPRIRLQHSMENYRMRVESQ